MSHFMNSLAAYADPDGFAAGPNSLHCLAVLYNGLSQAMVLDDAMYAKYPIGLMVDEEMRPNDTSYRAFWTALKHNTMAEFIRPLSDQGVSFFVCNNALSSLALTLAKRTAPGGGSITREQVVAIHDELAEHFIPGTMLVPSGVAAVNAAQEAKFTFLP
jgi:intracellular sulfur oxidation DsrE/DsrF family protein